MKNRNTKLDTELQRLESVLREWRASLSHTEIERLRSLDREEAQRARKTLDYMTDALRRFGIKGDLGSYQSFTEAMPLFSKAWKKLGLPLDHFPDQQPRFLFKLIEERLDLLSRLGNPSSDAATFFKEIAGRLGGRRGAKLLINVNKLPPRGKRSWDRYARKLGISRETLRRIMKGLPVSDATVSRLGESLKVPREELLIH